MTQAKLMTRTNQTFVFAAIGWSHRQVRLASVFACVMLCCWASAADSQTQSASKGNSDHADSVRFRDDVRPILSNHCFACHGPDETHREADLRLDVQDEVDIDEFVARITSNDPDQMMPPPEMNKPLNDSQIKTLSQWAATGAPYQQHWAFVSALAPALPQVEDESWIRQPIDRFVLHELERRDLHPSPVADKRTMIRRLSLDLTGLPPTVDQIHAFLADESIDAYENLVDRLISQSAYGEHMARYWLDLVRFADTNGLHHDHYREMTLYRDWVIRSFNDDLPFDRFIKYQIAGDLYPNPSHDQLIASGFHRLHLIIDRGTALPEESAFRNVVDRVSSVGTAFMGLTMQCAVCHDHKYDPITQKDFYQLSAFFNNFDGEPETGRRGSIDFKRGLQQPYLEFPTPEQEAKRNQLDAELAKLQAKTQTLKKQLAAAQKEIDRLKSAAKSEKKSSENQTDSTDELLGEIDQNLAKQRLASVNQAIKRIAERQKQITAKRDEISMMIPAALVMKERSEIRPTHIMVRGAYDQPGEEVQRDTPGFLPPMRSDGDQKTRLDLANWMVAPENPLTARVAVNRFWQQFFGVGLVRTSEDFGSQGETPSHPELLDHLAIEFVESGWDVKDLVRRIVLSQTYRQSSKAQPDRFKTDPQNRLLSRGSRFRLDAEVVRDQWLSVSGLLHNELYGKSVKPPQPEGLWKIVAMPSSFPNSFSPDSGDKVRRRSVYTFWKRGLPPPQMTVFDAPTRESCIARRERTNTPLQALLLMNEEQHFAAAKHYANVLLQDADTDDGQGVDDQRIELAYESITSQLPSDEIKQQLKTALKQFRQVYADDVELAKRLTRNDTSINDESSSELAAWTMLVHSLLNLDATRTRE